MCRNINGQNPNKDYEQDLKGFNILFVLAEQLLNALLTGKLSMTISRERGQMLSLSPTVCEYSKARGAI